MSTLDTIGGSQVANTATSFVVEAAPSAPVILPDGLALRGADFARTGGDLVVTATDGTSVVVSGFFEQSVTKLLFNGGDQQISADLAAHLAGPLAPGQVAQAGPDLNLSEPIGTVETTGGTVTATRTDGTVVELAEGDSVFQGDILETSADGGVGVVLADETTFSMGGDGRMVLDEMIYDPGTQEGDLAISVLEGVFTFVSGHIAKTDPDAMVLETPVATIGVRGTQVGLEMSDELELFILEELDGFVGEVSVSGNGWAYTMNVGLQGIQVTSAASAPPPPFQATIAQVLASVGAALQFLPEGTNANNYGQTREESLEDLDDLDTAAGGEEGSDGGDGGPPPAAAIPPALTFGFAAIESGIQLAAAAEVLAAEEEFTEEEIEDEPLIEIVEEELDLSVLVGTDGDDTIDGGDSDDIILGLGGNDTITGGSGDDTLVGGPGNDTIDAGPGNDLIIAGEGEGDDDYDGGSGNDTISFTSTIHGVTVVLSEGVAFGNDEEVDEIGVDQLAGIENVIGGSGDDVLIGDDANSITASGLLVDTDIDDYYFTVTASGTVTINVTETIVDLSDFDTEINLFHDDGSLDLSDFIANDDDGGEGLESQLSLQLDPGDYVLRIGTHGFGDAGGTSTDIIGPTNPGGHHDGSDYTLSITGPVLTAFGGGNALFGLAGDDILFGGKGDDYLDGGAGSDTLDLSSTGTFNIVDLAAGYAEGGTDSFDTLVSIENAEGGSGTDLLFGTGGVNRLEGNSGSDDLYGRGGDDLLFGGKGDDYLDGGSGNDTLTGGFGDDTFVFGAGDGTENHITDMEYDSGESGDEILFHGFAEGDITIIGGEGQNPDRIVASNASGTVEVVIDGQSGQSYQVTDVDGDTVVVLEG